MTKINLATLGARGTDVVVAGLTLPRRFRRGELIEVYGKLRRDRGDALSPSWQQGISNELHRLSSDFAQFHKEGHTLDLIARVGPGEYCFRDTLRPKLIAAANQRDDLFITSNTLVVPVETDDAADSDCISHLIGVYAQQKIMMAVRGLGHADIEDTSSGRSYDFTFRGRNRYDTQQIMECKGTRRNGGDFTVTPNEINVMTRNQLSYWLGVVYCIDVVDGIASGGSDPFITRPPILDRWHFTKSFRLRRLPETPATLFDPPDQHLRMVR